MFTFLASGRVLGSRIKRFQQKQDKRLVWPVFLHYLSVVMTEYPKELSEMPDDYALASDKIEITRGVINGQS